MDKLFVLVGVCPAFRVLLLSNRSMECRNIVKNYFKVFQSIFSLRI